MHKQNRKRSNLTKVVNTAAKTIFKKLLMRFGVGGLASSVATHFIFKYIFKRMANHLLARGHIDSYQYTLHGMRIIVHRKGVECVKSYGKSKSKTRPKIESKKQSKV